MSPEIIIALVLSGVVVGFSSALFGVGGGILMVPLIVLLFGRSQHLAEGTSLLVIVPTAIVGVYSQRKTGNVSFRHAGLLAVGGVGGAYLGAAVALHLPHRTLQALFGALLLLTGLRVLRAGVNQWRARIPSVEGPPVRLEPSGLDYESAGLD